MIVDLASNASESTSSKTLGLMESTVNNNGFGNVITEGLLAGLDTSTATSGDPVWLGTGGNLIYGLVNKPVAPAHLVFIGIVTRSNANNGEIFIKPQNGFELSELHTVLLDATASIADNEVLAFDSASGLWKNQTAAEAGLQVIVSGVSDTEIGYLDGVTSAIQTQLDAKAPSVSPSFTTPSLGVATATSINGTSIPSSKTLVVTTDIGSSVQAYDADLAAIAVLSGTSGLLKKTSANTWELDTTAYLTSSTGVTAVNGSSGAISNVALTSDTLGQFAATTSSQLAGIISDETGSGALVFANTPTLVTPVLGVATATSINGTTIPSSSTLVTTTSTQTLSSKTLTSPKETTTTTATAATGTINYDVTTQADLYYTTAATGNFVLNFRANSSVSLNSYMSTGETVTLVFRNTNGSTAYYPTAIQVDGSSLTKGTNLFWQGGTAPTSGNSSSIDVYTVAITKTATNTFVALASQTKFA
jgi:hypothetical protein